jgi:hypothetical protein
MSLRPAPVLLFLWSLVLAFAWFWPALVHGFRSDDFFASYYWDADRGANWSRAFGEFVRPWFGVRDLYRPIVSLSLAANFELGSSALGFHVVNTLLLAITAFAAAMVAMRLVPLRRGFAAAIAAAVVVVHPASVETTAWISARTAGLEVCFATLAAWAFVRRMQGAGTMLPVLLAGACALLSKEGAVMLPLLLVALDVAESPRRPWRERWRLHAAVIGMVVVYFVWRRWLLGVVGTAEAGHSMLDRVAVTAVRAVTWVAPSDPDQHVHWLSVLSLLVLLAAAAMSTRARSAWLLACGAALLLPSSQLREAIGLMSGRLVFSSVPLLSVVVACCAADAVGRRPAKWIAWLALGALLGSLGVAGRAWLQRYGEEDALLSDVRRELAIAAAGGEPGRPIGCSMLPGLPLLQTHVWGLLGVRPFAERDLGLATLAGMLQLDPDCPGLFGDAAIAHALAELGGGVVTWNPDARTFVPVRRPERLRVELVHDAIDAGVFAAPAVLPATAFAAIEVTAVAPVGSIRLRLRDDVEGAWAFGAIEQTLAPPQRTATFDVTHALAVQLFAANGAPFRGFVIECDGAPAPAGTVVVAHATLPTEPLRAPFVGREVAVAELVKALQPPRQDLPLRLYLMTPLRTMGLDAVVGSAFRVPSVEQDRLRLSAAMVDGCAAHWYWQTPPGYSGSPWRSGLDWCRLR